MPEDKVEKTMHEFKHGKLHSGSKEGPKVTSRKQAIAIGLAQARRAGEDVTPKKNLATAEDPEQDTADALTTWNKKNLSLRKKKG